MSKTIEYLRCALVGALFAICGTQTLAQSNPFEAVVRVNDRVITAFEIDQRQRFLEVLRAPDTSREAVIDILIEDQLKLEAAERFGVQSTEGSMQVGMANFAAQANLSIDQFLQAIGDAGIAPETFRDFVRVSLVWGNLVRGRFSAQAQISDAEIDRAVAIGEGQGNVQVLLSEIILPLDPQVARTNSERAALIAEMTNQESFSRAARQFSVAPSRDQGGRLDWVPLSELPPAIGPLFIAMQPGEVTAPLTLGGGQALALFQLRDLRDARPAAVSLSEVTYMLVRLSDPTQASA
ncbi:MAG: peptidylprolyl isomerase [Pseudomonadota bacterium]